VKNNIKTDKGYDSKLHFQHESIDLFSRSMEILLSEKRAINDLKKSQTVALD